MNLPQRQIRLSNNNIFLISYKFRKKKLSFLHFSSKMKRMHIIQADIFLIMIFFKKIYIILKCLHYNFTVYHGIFFKCKITDTAQISRTAKSCSSPVAMQEDATPLQPRQEKSRTGVVVAWSTLSTHRKLRLYVLDLGGKRINQTFASFSSEKAVFMLELVL